MSMRRWMWIFVGIGLAALLLAAAGQWLLRWPVEMVGMWVGFGAGYLVGAALFAMEENVDPAPIVRTILAALRFDRADDASAAEIQKALREQGIDYVLSHYMSLNPEEKLYPLIRDAYREENHV